MNRSWNICYKSIRRGVVKIEWSEWSLKAHKTWLDQCDFYKKLIDNQLCQEKGKIKNDESSIIIRCLKWIKGLEDSEATCVIIPDITSTFFALLSVFDGSNDDTQKKNIFNGKKYIENNDKSINENDDSVLGKRKDIAITQKSAYQSEDFYSSVSRTPFNHIISVNSLLELKSITSLEINFDHENLNYFIPKEKFDLIFRFKWTQWKVAMPFQWWKWYANHHSHSECYNSFQIDPVAFKMIWYGWFQNEKAKGYKKKYQKDDNIDDSKQDKKTYNKSTIFQPSSKSKSYLLQIFDSLEDSLNSKKLSLKPLMYIFSFTIENMKQSLLIQAILLRP